MSRIWTGRIHLPSLLLPLLALSVTFTSKPLPLEKYLNQLFSTAFMACAIYVFYRACRNEILAITISLLVVVLRLARAGASDAGGALDVVYYLPYCVVLLVAGARMMRDYPQLLLRQMVWLCGMSAALSLLQIQGVQWAQALSNFYWYRGGSSEWYLFVPWSELPEVNGVQARPVGFASANNVLSQFLLFFYAFASLWFARRKTERPPGAWLFVIAFAGALSGAKLVAAGIAVINVAALMIAGSGERFYVWRIWAISGAAYGLYFVLFPGLFVSNLNLDLLAFNIIVRVLDLSGRIELPFVGRVITFLSQYNTGEFVGARDPLQTLERFGASEMTGVGSLVGVWRSAAALFAVLLPSWILRLRRLTPGPGVDVRRVVVIMAVATAASLAGGPFILTSYFWFFFAFAAYPFTVRVLHPSLRPLEGR